MRRVSVVGNSGSGKTTFAADLARRMGVPHLELDSVFHQPGWVPLPPGEFRARVAEFAAAPGWVIDGNYTSVRDIVWDRADTVVWLDPPRWRVIRQVTWRTLRRAVTRAELWNGNREPWGNFFRLDPERSVIAWAWTRHRVYRDRYRHAMADPAHSHLRFVRVAGPGEAAAVLAAAAGDGPGTG